MVAVTRLHHVGVYVADLTRALRFYRDAMGLPVVYERPGLAMLTAGDNHIELIEPAAESPLRRQAGSEWEGPNHIAFETTDLTGALAELASRGAKLRDESARSLPNYLFAFLAGEVFDGVSVELVQMTLPYAEVARHPEVLGFERVVLSFPDVQSAGFRLEDYFGLEVDSRAEHETTRPIAILKAGECKLELVEGVSFRSGGAEGVRGNLGGFMLAVRNLIALVSKLRAADMPVSDIFVDAQGRRFAYVHASATGRVPITFLETEFDAE